MLGIVIAAVVMLFCGTTIFSAALDWRDHPGRFIFYWLICGWLTITSVLLALYDLLMLRADARTERRGMAQKLTGSDSPNDA